MNKAGKLQPCIGVIFNATVEIRYLGVTGQQVGHTHHYYGCIAAASRRMQGWHFPASFTLDFTSLYSSVYCKYALQMLRAVQRF